MASPLQQKLRVSGPVVITANRLSDGAVVHRTASGQWTEKAFSGSGFLERGRGAERAQGGTVRCLAAVGPYVAPIDASKAAAQPGNLRELSAPAAQPSRYPATSRNGQRLRFQIGRSSPSSCPSPRQLALASCHLLLAAPASGCGWEREGCGRISLAAITGSPRPLGRETE